MSDFMRAVNKLIKPLRSRVEILVGRAVLRAVDDTSALQTMQIEILDGEVLDGVERFQNYGLTSVPFVGAEKIVLSIGGSRSHTLIIVVDDRRYRLTGLAEGEVALYDDQGQVVHVKRNGLHLKGNNVLIETDGVFRVDADGIEMHARTYRQDDLAGYGKRTISLGGVNFHEITYLDTPVFDTPETNAIMPTAIPSDHPEAAA